MDIKKLLEQMTIKEKVGQLLQLPPHNFIKTTTNDIAGNVYDLGLSSEQVFHAGSVLGIRNAEEMIEVQSTYLKRSRLKIPLLFMADVVHGYETIFPIPIALGCSWNEQLAYQMARVSGTEASVGGIHLTFAPVADLTRDPRWGRVMEGFGEDPYLLSNFTKQLIKGFQTTSMDTPFSLAACVKHFAAYGAAEAGRDYNTVDMSRYAFYSMYSKGYQAAIDVGVKAVMASFNTFDGIPVTINKELMVDILRDKFGFDGIAISDYDGLNQVIDHGAAEDKKDAALKGIKAKIDVEMVSSCYTQHLEQIIDNGDLSIAEIDEAVLRILSLKEDLDLFENPYRFADPTLEHSIVRSEEHLEATKQSALESAVLLQNNGVLPLSESEKVAIMGPFAKSKGTNGPWSWHGDTSFNSSLYDVLKEQRPDLYYADSIDELKQTSIKNIVYVTGENEHDSGEAKSKVSLRLPKADIENIRYLIEHKYQVVVVLYNGRPLVLSEIVNADAIVEGWFLGSKGSEALVELLLGKSNFSGKLTMSFPRHEGQIPLYYNHLSTGRPHNGDVSNAYTSFYLDCPNEPLFPFGHGLSYSSFHYDQLRVFDKVVTEKKGTTLSVDITNKSDIDGFEIVQLYMHDVSAMVSRPIQELIGYQKVWIPSNSTRTISFDITMNDLTYTTAQNEQMLEPGDIKLMVGTSSAKTVDIKIQYQQMEEMGNEIKM